jgi:hypothetical protein
MFNEWFDRAHSIALGFLAEPVQNPHDGHNGVPIPGRRPRTEQFVDLAKIADRFHVATVFSEDESLLRGDTSHEPLSVWWKTEWDGSHAAVGFRQDAYESNNIGAWRLGPKRIFHLHPDKIATVAEHHFSFEWQFPEQFSPELCSRSGFSNDEGACRTHIHDTVFGQFSGEEAWAKRSVSAHIYSSEKNNECHSRIIW